MPTTNPVPSQDPSDLLFNAGKLDEVLNGTGTSFTDRLGTARRTVSGMNADFDAQLADAESDLNVYRADAAASAAQALGYLNTIRTTSYGAYASDPATDPLGNPPNVGDEYFNTTSNLLKRFNGTTWQASDINTANLAAPSGSSLVGYDTGTVQDVLDAVTGPNGAASVGYTPAGTGAVATDVQTALRSLQSWQVVSVKDPTFGAAGDGVTNDHSAIVSAIAYLSSVGGGKLFFPRGNYLVNSSFTVPNHIIFEGEGKRKSVIKRGFTGDLITSWGGYCGLVNIGIDGQQAIFGAGRGFLMPATTPSSFMLMSSIANFSQACLEFATDAGSTFRAVSCDFYTSGALGVVAAVKVAGIDTEATSRHFIGCESGGCTMYDFGGCSDFHVTGGYTNGLIFGAASSKVFITNLRVGAAAGAQAIYGSQHQISNSVYAVDVTLFCTNSKFDCEVPSYNITDNGSNNNVYIYWKNYTPTWTSTGGGQSLGNGSIAGRWSRRGNTVSFQIDFSIGSTTNVGSGSWEFGLPVPDYAFAPVQLCGVGFAANSAATSATVFAVRVAPGGQKVTGFYGDAGTGAAKIVGAVSPAATWGAGSTVRMSGSYVTT